MHNIDCMIYTNDGCWLQTAESDGRRRLSWCGRLGYDSARQFAYDRGLPFYDWDETKARPVRASARAASR